MLAALATDPGTDQNTLAGALSIDTSTLAEVCLRLASRGLIERERSEIDARRYRLYLTPTAGRSSSATSRRSTRSAARCSRRSVRVSARRSWGCCGA